MLLKFVTTHLYVMNPFLLAALVLAASLTLDYYVFQALKVSLKKAHGTLATAFRVAYVLLSVLVVIAVITLMSLPENDLWILKMFSITLVMGNLIGKILASLFLLIDDLRRYVIVLNRKFKKQEREKEVSSGEPITRSEFLAKASLATAVLPLATMGVGILSGAYDYRVRKKTIYLPKLPRSMDGIRLAQVSDIHSGSFFNKIAVQGGVELLLKQKPDFICFTGDIVNYQANELNDYLPVFEKLKAPLGVYSILGNHDYGDYVQWPNEVKKRQNLEKVIAGHKQMGWDILLNENRKIQVEGDYIDLIGVENWGTKFVKHGQLDKAYEGLANGTPKILLSHDPSHWDAQVRPTFSDIDLTLSGHTHGMQFGVEIGDFRWSPVKYLYKQWADLYRENDQYLYVNRGFGFIGFPGRIGILPEITILELKSGEGPPV